MLGKGSTDDQKINPFFENCEKFKNPKKFFNGTTAKSTFYHLYIKDIVTFALVSFTQDNN